MAEVYGAVSDQILVNLARYFPYYTADDQVPRSAFTYQAKMLAQMGQVNRETVRIIREGLADADNALHGVLEAAIMDSVKTAEPELYNAVKLGVFNPPSTPVLAPNQMRAFQLYYKQAADKLNLVNTVMLESTQQAYQATVSGIVAELNLPEAMNRVQIGLDTAAGETITGVSSWNTAVKHATDRMKDAGITGFIDHAGRHWSAEAYAAMDVRTTTFNTARAAVWETNQNFGNDLYLVSWHNGARPLCYDWQNKVISSTNVSRTVVDLDGNEIHVYAQSETSYGQPAGLFGINCGHYPNPFIPGVSKIHGEPQSKEENDRTYAESQEQRRLERKLREQKRDVEMLKAQNAPPEQIKAARAKCRETSQQIDDFCEQTGRTRHRDREAVYTKREFPAKDTYDASTFTRERQERQAEYFRNGGAQTGYSPIGPQPGRIPITPITPTTPTAGEVAQQATQTTEDVVQSQADAFTPAKTRAEAEQYAQEHFANSVTYNGSISVDTMNTINHELKDLTDAYPIEKLRSIEQNGRMKALACANGGTLKVNGKSIHQETGGASYRNRQLYYKKQLEKMQSRFPEGIPRYYQAEARKYEEILKFSRWTIDDPYESSKKVRATISHEYGHILADQYCGQINRGHFCKTYDDPATVSKRKLITDTFKKAKQTGDIYKLSEYGSTNDHEFFAETFSALWMKEDLPDYFVDMIRGVCGV